MAKEDKATLRNDTSSSSHKTFFHKEFKILDRDAPYVPFENCYTLKYYQNKQVHFQDSLLDVNDLVYFQWMIKWDEAS